MSVYSGEDCATTNDEHLRAKIRSRFGGGGAGDRHASYIDRLFVKTFSGRFQGVTTIQF
jgi:hypothetical protein